MKQIRKNGEPVLLNCFYACSVPVMVMSKLKFVIELTLDETDRVRTA